MIYVLFYLHVFIEQHHENEAEEDTSSHHAGQKRSEEFMGDDSFWEETHIRVIRQRYMFYCKYRFSLYTNPLKY